MTIPFSSYNLFLDDVRDPAKVYPYSKRPQWMKTFVVCRSYNAAVQMVRRRGFPSFVSFDHDLGETSQSGYDFAKYLVELDLSKDTMPSDFSYEVHSMNPVGARNIREFLDGYLRFKFNE